jgi:hypothetical protein
MFWLNTEPVYDWFAWGVSIDDYNYDVYGAHGDSGGWIEVSTDLADPDGLGDFTGQDQVWIAFLFNSDFTVTEPNGVFVDNIVLRQCETNCPLSSSGKDLSSLGLQYKTFHIER